jgi:hypothetical protein
LVNVPPQIDQEKNFVPNFEVLFLVCFGLSAIMTIATLVGVTRLFGKLKRSHPAEYDRLGSPHLVMNNTPRSTLKFWYFLRDREYEALGDPAIIKAASTTRKMYVAMFSLYAVSLGLLLIVWGRM